MTHLEDDPVTSPIHVDLRPQPLEAFVQQDLSPFDIPLGETMSYVFQITNRSIPSLTWTLFADGEEILKDKVDVATPEVTTKPESMPVVPQGGARPGN